jgi:hypothetical protein
MEITLCIIADHSGIKLDLNNKRKSIFKHRETEQQMAENPMGNQSNKGRNKKVPRIKWQ